MDALISFGVLGVLLVIGAWAVRRAEAYRNGADVRRESLESLVSLCGSDQLTADERRNLKPVIESQMQRL
jgi:hypothetical protein